MNTPPFLFVKCCNVLIADIDNGAGADHSGNIWIMDEGQASRLRLQNFITEENAILHKILCQYVLRAGLVGSGDAGTVAYELLNEVIVEAFVHAERLKMDMQPRP